jgi:ABC-type amino acid transport system permease subunit
MVAVIYFMISYPTAKFVEWVEARIDITRRPVVIGMRT